MVPSGEREKKYAKAGCERRRSANEFEGVENAERGFEKKTGHVLGEGGKKRGEFPKGERHLTLRGEGACVARRVEKAKSGEREAE